MVVQSKGWLSVGCFPNILGEEIRIPLHVDDSLDSLDDHLKTEGEYRPYEVR